MIMKRDWLGEIKRVKSVRAIARETGISRYMIDQYIKGKKPLKSGTRHYEKIRNLNRVIGYETMRKHGESVEEATRFKRTALDPERKVTPKEFPRETPVKTDVVSLGETAYQMMLTANYIHRVTQEIRMGMVSFSKELQEDKK